MGGRSVTSQKVALSGLLLASTSNGTAILLKSLVTPISQEYDCTQISLIQWTYVVLLCGKAEKTEQDMDWHIAKGFPQDMDVH